MSEEVFYVTTPLYYVNAAPHLGHAYATIGADVLARYQRAKGREVYFLTGTDEHGQKVERASQEKGYPSPKALADDVVQHFKSAWELLNISHDRFIRTTDEDHKAAAQAFWKQVASKGYIEKRLYEGWYCIYEENFWPESQLIEPGHLCPECQRPTVLTKEENFFFKQTAFVEAMRQHLEKHPDFVRPEIRRNEILGSYLGADGAVHDQSISRSNFRWGIPVPGDEKQVIYVWFDALINYITAAGWPSDMERFGRLWPADVHIIGKDILRFHAVLWQAMLLAAGLELPKQVFGTGMILDNGRKMSKSFGNGVDPIDWSKRFGVDVFRYYLLREVPFGADGSVSEEGIQGRYNTELANELGNLLNRSLTMLEKYCDGKVPAADADRLGLGLEAFWPRYEAAMESLSFHEALEAILSLIRLANRHIDDEAPWKLAKDPAQRGRLDACLKNLIEVLRVLGFALSPFMPDTSVRFLAQLGLKDCIGAKGELKGTRLDLACRFGAIPVGHATAKGEPLFPRSEAAAV
jgi:methionyl-tRNA synthetase